ncbi:MAG: ASKHA domain-containing protein [Nitrospirota bacterium]
MNINLTSGKSIKIEQGTSVLEALKESGIHLTTSCGGKGTCGKCKVVIQSGSADIQSTMKLTQDEISKGYALACKTFPSEDMFIDLPKESMLIVEGKIATGRSKDLLALLESTGAKLDPFSERTVMKLPPPSLDDNISDLERLKRELLAKGLGCLRVPYRFLGDLAKKVRKENWEITLSTIHSDDCYEITCIFPGSQKMPQYGVAIDIGTTTIVVFLVDLANGKLVDAASVYNSQIRFGDDVITRIVNATEHNELKKINKAVISDINILLSHLKHTHHISSDHIDCFVISGNTTMIHFFLGLDPSAIREEPYIPTANIFPISYAGELGLQVNPDLPVYSFPCVASYVGGDIVSGVLATRLHKKEELSIFIDIGTNGEIVLGNNEWLMSAACSAGPCFEGSGIKHGMRATDGAIEDVKINPDTLDIEIEVIGDDIQPTGICGSGMIDAIAGMFMAGILDQKGKLQKEISDRVREGEDGPEFVIHYGAGKGKDIVLSEPDIENIVRAKAAIYAGFSTLLNEVGFTFNDVQKIYIAGGFGKFLDIEKAIILGMLPELPREKFEYMGNTSIIGAYLCLVSQKMRWEAEEISREMTYLELSVSRSFMDEYVSGLFIPHTDIDAFPGVKKRKGHST